MTTSERKKAILGVLAEDHRVHAGTLAARFGVSEDTIRRDLRSLADDGMIRRIYGGAVPHTPVSDSYTKRITESVASKATIARLVIPFFKSGQTVFIDAGTTTEAIVTALPVDLRLTVVTHSLPVAAALVHRPLIEVIMLGGRLLKEAAATVGVEAVNGYLKCHADICVLAVASVHAEVGLGVLSFEDAEVKRAMIASAAEVMVVAAAEKFGTSAPFLVAPLSSVDRVITDATADDETARAIQNAGIDLVRPNSL